RPDGRLNDRAGAAAEIQATLPALDGPRWAKVRRMLTDSRSLTFLDQVHRDLAAAEPRADVRAALVALWRLRHATRPGCGAEPSGAVGVVLPVVQALLAGPWEPSWHGAYRRGGRGLGRGERAPSVAGGRHNAVRGRPAGDRPVRPPAIRLQPPYWECRAAAEGGRGGDCAYPHRGLHLPTYDWWELLHTEPRTLEQKVSNRPVAA